jgi:hypothetical protein
MLEAKLSPCASLLYQWVLLRISTDNKLKIDLQDFQAWTGEFREKSYSYGEVFTALCQLKDLNLVNISRTEITLEPKISDRFDLDRKIELASEKSPEEHSPSRWLVLTKILFFSGIFSLTSVAIGLSLCQLQPQTLDTPHPWSVLADRNQ